MIPIAEPRLGEDERARVTAVFESGQLADGPEVRAFEREFAEYCSTDHAIATTNGTTALHATLEGLGVGEGDRVLTTPFTFVATANAIRLVGAEPVFADIDPVTYNLEPEAARRVARERDVDAIVLVHLYGLPANVEAFEELAGDLGVPLLEDAAQAHGATVDGQPVGSFGDAACFSFYPTKNLTTGEGGMVVTDRADVTERVERFVDHGRTEGYRHASVGHNFRMTSLAAAIGRVQLERLPDFLTRRRENAARLSEGLADTPLRTPVEPSGLEHAYHQYTVRTEDRDGLLDHLGDHGIGAAVYYPRCVHEQPAYDDVDHVAPVAERLSEEVLSLPVHPGVTPEETARITEVTREYVTA
ncbi:DegT/DnrJ/EryC1/StrS family aminotransferase [Natrialbaceae archaeon A-gly3]